MQAVQVPTRSGRFGPRSKREPASAHIETIDSIPAKSASPPVKQYPFVEETVADHALPFIDTDLVVSQSKNANDQDDRNTLSKELWIVIDNIVYDCSEFAEEHPGGESVILSFVGEDCSWQFWRLHGKSVMEQYGRGLRVGRTKDIKNRFSPTKQFVGLSSLGDDGW